VYGLIKSKPENLTPGQGEEGTLQSASLRWFRTTSNNKLVRGKIRVESSCWIKWNRGRIKKSLSVFTFKAFYPLESYIILILIMSVIYVKFFTVRPLLQVTTRWSELCQVGSAKVNKPSDWLNISNKENQNKLLHLKTVHYITEKHSNSLSPTRDRRSNGNIAPIRFRTNKHLLGTRCFSSFGYQRFFQKKIKNQKNRNRG
jgi:hypothetical protein